MKTFIYNYWNDLGAFYFDGHELEYRWNGYNIPNELLQNPKFRLFFNTVSSSAANVRLDAFVFTTEDCEEFLRDANLSEIDFDLFAKLDNAEKKEDTYRVLRKKWATREIVKTEEYVLPKSNEFNKLFQWGKELIEVINSQLKK